jgi:hypothetical protein
MVGGKGNGKPGICHLIHFGENKKEKNFNKY